MTHDELLASIERMTNHDAIFMKDALRAVVRLHKPDGEEDCSVCLSWPIDREEYPCKTIRTIEKELL